jgi:hypothetical protein
MQAHTTATIPSLEHRLWYHFQQTPVIQLSSSFHELVANQSKPISMCSPSSFFALVILERQ